MHYLRHYPDRVRSLILDAVVPPGRPLGPDIAPAAQAALDEIFERCAASDDCAKAFPDLPEVFASLMTDLDAAAEEVEFEDFNQGRMETLMLTREMLAVTLRLLSYSAETAALIPALVHEAGRDGNFSSLARQVLLQTRALDESIATGMHHAVVCTEDIPFLDDAESSRNPPHGSPQGYLGETLLSGMRAACDPWPEGFVDENLHAPLVSSVPTLILSGSADPITPPEFGEMLIDGFDNARHIVNDGQGHMQAMLGCLPSVMAQFVINASSEALDLDCLERITPPPFFVDANGPLP
ncbi:MAG: hypothetical protein CSA54_02980 [Gammaproteobacteria bacterium]|nr:MAG: hypothetical protein CSA54_02980 [Gammaproteobacteria bacterium]